MEEHFETRVLNKLDKMADQMADLRVEVAALYGTFVTKADFMETEAELKASLLETAKQSVNQRRWAVTTAVAVLAMLASVVGILLVLL